MKRSNIYLRAGAMLLALMLALLLSACGSDDDGGETDAGSQETSQPEETEEAPVEGEQQIAVTATEFEFTGIDPTVPAGETTFNFVNDGKQPHEFIMFKLTEDAPPLDELLKLSEKKAEGYFEGPPESAFAKPGESQEGAFTTELTAGNYAYVCFVEDKKTKQPHAFLGMVGAFSVQ